MSNKADPEQLKIYQIKIEGHLDDQWSDWFEGMKITQAAGGITLIAGPVADDAALHGLLKRVRDLGIPLLAVNRIEPHHRNGCG